MLGTVQGWGMNGGRKVHTSGLSSSTDVQKSYPNALVTVYLTGTQTLASIYSDQSSTPLSNPFTAKDDGSYLFWADTGAALDLVISKPAPSNHPPYPSPPPIITLVGVVPYYPFSSTGQIGPIINAIDYRLLSPPDNPSVGDTYVIAGDWDGNKYILPTGAWAGQLNNIAIWNGSSWQFTAPLQDWIAYIQTIEAPFPSFGGGGDYDYIYFDGAAWGNVIVTLEGITTNALLVNFLRSRNDIVIPFGEEFSIGTQYGDARIAVQTDGYNTSGTIYALSSVTSADPTTGDFPIYSGTFPDGGDNALAGKGIAVAGFSHAGNNGLFPCTASTTNSITLDNLAALAQTQVAYASPLSSNTSNPGFVQLMGNLRIGAPSEIITTYPYIIGETDHNESQDAIAYTFDCSGGDITVGLPESLGGFNGYTQIYIFSRCDSNPGNNNVLRIASNGGTVNGLSQFDIRTSFGGCIVVGNAEAGISNQWTAVASTTSIFANSADSGIAFPGGVLVPQETLTISFPMVGAPIGLPVKVSPTSGVYEPIGIVVEGMISAPNVVTIRMYNSKPPADDGSNDINTHGGAYFATAGT